MSNVISNIGARMDFENAQMALIRANPGVPNFDVNAYKITQSFLRLEATAVVGQTQYNFLPLINQAPILGSEQRLNLQDSFVISQIGFFLGLAASSADTEFIPQSYPDPLLFPLGAADLRRVYNGGSVNITVNNNVLVPNWDLTRHYMVPETQSDIAAGAPPPSARLNQIDLATDGFYPMEPNIILVGAKNNQITVNLKEGLPAVDANTRLILILRGMLVQNSTVVS